MSKATENLQKQADLLFENIAGWETRTLEYIGARINKTGKLSPADVKQLNNIAVVKQDMDDITRQLARVTGYNVSQIEKMYGDVIDSQHKDNKYLYDYRNKPFIPFSESRELQALVRAYAKSSAETMINISKTKALGFLDEAGNFRDLKSSMYDALGKACAEVATGATDFNTAMRRTIEALGGSGIRVDYGGGITRSLESAVRSNVLWGAKQVSVEYDNMIGEELGCDGIEIDYHSNPRPSHEFMQGKQYSLDGKKTINGVTYESAEGALARLDDYGCLHFKTPIILGISEPTYSDEELAELKRKDKEKKTVDGVEKSGYEWQQAMRRLETEARKEKNTIVALKAAGDEEGARQHRQRLSAINKKYDSICEQTGFKSQKQRVVVYAVSNVSKGLTSSKNSISIEMYRKGATHRRVTSDGRKIIDKPTYHKITNPIIKQGADIRIAKDEWLEHLKSKNASAVTIGDVIYFREDATVSDVLEETHHFLQNKKGLNNQYNDKQRIILNEIDAKEYLLSMTEKYHIPDNEVELTKSQLESYKELMREMKERNEWYD